MESIYTVLIVISLLGLVNCALLGSLFSYEQPCPSPIYCIGGEGSLLHTVQMSENWVDSKGFVDRPLMHAPAIVLENFRVLMEQTGSNPTKEQIKAFVDANFHANSTEFIPWRPDDWLPNPKFLDGIKDAKLKTWGKTLHEFWDQLGRHINTDVRDNKEMYSMIYVPHPVIVPGGRFKEFYYWDSYWIQEGLLLSEMNKTVKGMINNFVYMVDELGYVPNGGRIYFERSQPPLLIPMVKNYVESTGDYSFLRDIISALDKEFNFWVNNRTVIVNHFSGDYRMLRYDSNKGHPRPESYAEDYNLAKDLETLEEREELYRNLHAGAESGWDYSSKWFDIPEGVSATEDSLLKYIKTSTIVPAELNAIFFYNAKLMIEFHKYLENTEKAAYYENVANEYQEAINNVLWDEVLGCWFDFDLKTNSILKEFYPTNIVPLWAGAQKSDEVVKRVVNYLRDSGAAAYKSGVPASLLETGEQWDYPNGWAPSQSMIIQGLERSKNAEAKALAFEFAQKWINTNYKSFYFNEPHHMYEKYDVTLDGQPGGGGEYEVVVGFGWTNGVVLDLLHTYGDRLTSSSPKSILLSPLTIVLVCASLLSGVIWGASKILRYYRRQDYAALNKDTDGYTRIPQSENAPLPSIRATSKLSAAANNNHS